MNSEQTVDPDDDAPLVTQGKMRAEAIKRLQIGLTGLAVMLLLVGLANVIKDRAKQSEQAAEPEVEAQVVVAKPTPAPNKDPLADAGVVPELPSAASPSPGATASPKAGNAASPSR
jgi:hypothetical protein